MTYANVPMENGRPDGCAGLPVAKIGRAALRLRLRPRNILPTAGRLACVVLCATILVGLIMAVRLATYSYRQTGHVWPQALFYEASDGGR
jgi:hypothetical protein